jgi:3-hydroxymyristoyl/3-hydroxydecanoyl-(acyl carrier protein) dehydratase
MIREGIFGGADGSISAQIQVPAESPWFDGHFPGAPILPGVAQLSLAVDLLGEAMGYRVSVTEVSRVRFKQAIRPAETVMVHITPKEDPLSFGFHIESGPEPVCSGNIRIAGKVPGENATGAEITDPRREPKKEN